MKQNESKAHITSINICFYFHKLFHYWNYSLADRIVRYSVLHTRLATIIVWYCVLHIIRHLSCWQTGTYLYLNLEPREKMAAGELPEVWVSLKKAWCSTQHCHRCLHAALLGVSNPYVFSWFCGHDRWDTRGQAAELAISFIFPNLLKILINWITYINLKTVLYVGFWQYLTWTFCYPTWHRALNHVINYLNLGIYIKPLQLWPKKNDKNIMWSIVKEAFSIAQFLLYIVECPSTVA